MIWRFTIHNTLKYIVVLESLDVVLEFTMHNTLSNICCVGGIRCCVGNLPYTTHFQTYVLGKSLLDHRNVGCTYT